MPIITATATVSLDTPAGLCIYELDTPAGHLCADGYKNTDAPGRGPLNPVTPLPACTLRTLLRALDAHATANGYTVSGVYGHFTTGTGTVFDAAELLTEYRANRALHAAMRA